MEIYIDRRNYNCLVFENDKKQKQYCAIPPGKNRVDIITFEDINISAYLYKLNGLVIVTDSYTRKVIDEKGYVIDSVFIEKFEKKDNDIDDPKHPWNWKK